MGIKVTEGVFRALAKAMPERVAAEGKKTILHIAFGGVDPRKDEFYVYLETLAGGYGGRFGKDGEDAVQAHHQNTENAPIEELESGYPVMIQRYELIPDSEGPGRFRGGLGLRRQYRFIKHEPTVTILADTVKIPPHGTSGGMDGRPAKFSIIRSGKEQVVLGSKTTFTAGAHDVVSMETPGGGGYGKSIERDPVLVLNDVVQGKVSVERARAMYGVEVNVDTLTIDYESTKKLRSTKGSPKK